MPEVIIVVIILVFLIAALIGALIEDYKKRDYDPWIQTKKEDKKMKKYIKIASVVIALAIAVSALCLTSAAYVDIDHVSVTETVDVWHTITGITYNPHIVFKAATNPLTREQYEDKTPWLKTGEYVATSSHVMFYQNYDNYVKVGKLNAACEFRIVYYDASGAWCGYTVRRAVSAGEVCINALELERGSTADAVAYTVVSYAPGMTAAVWKKAQRYADKTVCRVKVEAEVTYCPGTISRDTIIKAAEIAIFG